MDLAKIIHFNHVSGGVPFPWFDALDERESRRVREQLGARLGMADPSPDDVEVYRALTPLWAPVAPVRAGETGFRLSSVLHAEQIVPRETLYLDWADDEDRFDSSIDCMRFADVNTYFDLIWYPDLDDLLLFDETFAWVGEVNLTGNVRIAHLSAPEIPSP